MKLLWIVVLAVIACRVLTGRWPWQWLALSGRKPDPLAEARALLGVSAGASRREITEAHRRLVARVHPDRGGTNAQVHEANAARDLLLQSLPPDHRDETT